MSVGKSSSDHKGLGFKGEHSNSKIIFVKNSVSNSFAETSADVATQKPYIAIQNKIASPSQVTGNRANVVTHGYHVAHITNQQHLIRQVSMVSLFQLVTFVELKVISDLGVLL